MGDFNVQCGLTKLAIKPDEKVWLCPILCVPQNGNIDVKHGEKQHIVASEYEWRFVSQWLNPVNAGCRDEYYFFVFSGIYEGYGKFKIEGSEDFEKVFLKKDKIFDKVATTLAGENDCHDFPFEKPDVFNWDDIQEIMSKRRLFIYEGFYRSILPEKDCFFELNLMAIKADVVEGNSEAIADAFLEWDIKPEPLQYKSETFSNRAWIEFLSQFCDEECDEEE